MIVLFSCSDNIPVTIFVFHIWFFSFLLDHDTCSTLWLSILHSHWRSSWSILPRMGWQKWIGVGLVFEKYIPVSQARSNVLAVPPIYSSPIIIFQQCVVRLYQGGRNIWYALEHPFTPVILSLQLPLLPIPLSYSYTTAVTESANTLVGLLVRRQTYSAHVS